MTLPALTFIDPRSSTFVRWAGVLLEELASYNVRNPVDEDSWADWAREFISIPEVAERGSVDPRCFSNWREWASHISQVLS